METYLLKLDVAISFDTPIDKVAGTISAWNPKCMPKFISPTTALYYPTGDRYKPK